MNRQEFLDVFFGEGNRISREEVESRPRLKALVAAFDQRARGLALLPRMADTSQQVTWYLLAFSEDDYRRGLEELRGFIGPTYARWEGVRANPNDSIDLAVERLTHGRCVRFFTLNREEFEAVWPPLERLVVAWAERPQRSLGERRGTTAVLREIDLALAAGDGLLAIALLRDLRQRGAISVENARFIEVLALASQQRWREILASPDFPDLCQIRRPWRVTEALVAAAHDVWLRDVEEGGDVDGALTVYQSHNDVFESLARVRGPLRDGRFLKTHALHLVATGQDRARLDLLVPIAPEAADRVWIAALAKRLPDEVPTTSARTAFDERAFDLALSEALASEDPASFSDLIVISAYEVGSLEAAESAIGHWRDLREQDRLAALERRIVRDAMRALETLVGDADEPPAPVTWREWFVRVKEDPSWSSAEAVARCGELEFEASDLADNPSLDAVTSALLASAEGPSSAVLLAGLPAFLSWLDRSDAPSHGATRVRTAVMEALALMSGWEAAGLEIAGDLLGRILDAGVSTEDYGDLLDVVDIIWERMASRRHANWFADTMEMLEFFPGDRARLLSTFSSGVGPLRGRSLSPVVSEGLNLTAAALGAHPVAELGSDEADAVVQADVRPGRVVGIYSLSPQTAARARDRLTRRYPGIEVVHRDDKAASDGLLNMVRAADLLIVAIGSAKHAATDAIDAHRPSHLPTVRHAFRGSTRIVEAVEHCIGEGMLA